jgi:5'-deoxynucleotidase YfbR-like HD superfamily hydrolase
MTISKLQKGKTVARAWQRMLSGRRLDLLEPSPLDIEIADIAHGLARVARWNGQTEGEHAFSVAQHSLLVLEIFDRLHGEAKGKARERMLCLLHDAPEYVVGDMISPFKAVVGGDYKAVENRLSEAIHLRYSLPGKTPAALKAKIKKADTIAAYYEAVMLAGFSRNEATKYFGQPQGITPDGLPLVPWSASIAEKRFAECFDELDKAMAREAAR